MADIRILTEAELRSQIQLDLDAIETDLDVVRLVSDHKSDRGLACRHEAVQGRRDPGTPIPSIQGADLAE